MEATPSMCATPTWPATRQRVALLSPLTLPLRRSRRSGSVKGESKATRCRVAGHVGVAHIDGVASIHAWGGVGSGPGTAVDTVLAGHRLGSGADGKESVVGNVVAVVAGGAVGAVDGKCYRRGG